MKATRSILAKLQTFSNLVFIAQNDDLLIKENFIRAFNIIYAKANYNLKKLCVKFSTGLIASEGKKFILKYFAYHIGNKIVVKANDLVIWIEHRKTPRCYVI